MSSTSAVVVGSVDQLYYSTPSFSTGKIKTVDGDSVSFAGDVYFSVGDFVKLTGSWEHHPKWGNQLKAKSFEFVTGESADLDVDGLAAYLARSKEFAGIGPTRAARLAEVFGKTFGSVLESQPERIAEAARMPLAQVEAARDAWLKHKETHATATWLASFGMTQRQINIVMESLGNSARAALTDDPYLLIGIVKGFGFSQTDEIALKILDGNKNHAGRLRAGVIHLVRESMNSGHCFVSEDDLVDQSVALLHLNELEAFRRMHDVIAGLASEGLLSVQAAPAGDMEGSRLVALPRLHKQESDLLVWWDGASRRRNPSFSAPVNPSAPGLNDGQRAAVVAALNNQITVITGGAGVGKTFTIQTILKKLDEYGVKRVSLCAPTGKAARRITEVTGRHASTIHRELGYQGEGRWTYGKTKSSIHPNFLPSEVVIVDEFSMVDVSLAWQLMSAINWKTTSVVLVGDPNQLPPVGPGSPLRDLISTGLVYSVELTEVVRQAGVLKKNSIDILSGIVAPTTKEGGAAPWMLYANYADPASVAGLVSEMFSKHLANSPYHALRDVQLVTPTKKGSIGTKELNLMLQRVVQETLYGVKIDGKSRFYPGDKVIQTKNDYDLGVMNGTIGIVKEVPPKPGNLAHLNPWRDDRCNVDLSFVVEFDGEGEKELTKKQQANIDLAYALTVHKVQGSQWPCVIALVHKSHSFMQNQSLFYTAVTRAEKTVIIIGDHWGVKHAATNRVIEKRRTFLSLYGAAYGRNGAAA